MTRNLRGLGLVIINGGITGDEEGRWTYVGHGGTPVIDYVLVDEESR